MTKAHPQLSADKRTIIGRKVKKLRREGILPANVFGKKIKSLSLQVPIHEFSKVLTQVGETGLVDLLVAGEAKPRPVLITSVHINPVTDSPLHADFHQVDLTEKVTAHIPVELVGESPAVKEKSAVLITLLDEIEVEALPTDLPENFSVDIAGLKEFNDSVLVKDLQVDTSKVTLKADLEAQVVIVQEPKEEEVTPPPTEAVAPAAEPPEALSEVEGAKGESEAVPTEQKKKAKPTPEKPSDAK